MHRKGTFLDVMGYLKRRIQYSQSNRIKDNKLIELHDGKIYRKALYLMVKTMVSCRFSLKSIASCADVWIAVSPTIFPRQPPEVLAALVGESSRGWATHWCHQTWLAGKSPIKMEV